MRREQLEFLISQYLDGTIGPADRAALEERLASDAEARRVLEEFRALDAVAKQAMPLPALDWQTLASRISANITDAAVSEAGPASLEATYADASEINEEYEYAIAQYADGTLPAEQRPALERRLAADPAARRMLEEYRSLDTLSKIAVPLPDVKWDRLAERISEAVAEQAAEREAVEEAPATYSRSLKWLRAAPMMAMAASLIVGLLVGITIIMNRETGNPAGPGGVSVARVAEVTGPVAEKPSGTSVAIVELVEPAGGGGFAALSSEVVSVPSRVELARAYRVQREREDGSSPF